YYLLGLSIPSPDVDNGVTMKAHLGAWLTTIPPAAYVLELLQFYVTGTVVPAALSLSPSRLALPLLKVVSAATPLIAWGYASKAESGTTPWLQMAAGLSVIISLLVVPLLGTFLLPSKRGPGFNVAWVIHVAVVVVPTAVLFLDSQGDSLSDIASLVSLGANSAVMWVLLLVLVVLTGISGPVPFRTHTVRQKGGAVSNTRSIVLKIGSVVAVLFNLVLSTDGASGSGVESVFSRLVLADASPLSSASDMALTLACLVAVTRCLPLAISDPARLMVHTAVGSIIGQTGVLQSLSSSIPSTTLVNTLVSECVDIAARRLFDAFRLCVCLWKSALHPTEDPVIDAGKSSPGALSVGSPYRRTSNREGESRRERGRGGSGGPVWAAPVLVIIIIASPVYVPFCAIFAILGCPLRPLFGTPVLVPGYRRGRSFLNATPPPVALSISKKGASPSPSTVSGASYSVLVSSLIGDRRFRRILRTQVGGAGVLGVSGMLGGVGGVAPKDVVLCMHDKDLVMLRVMGTTGGGYLCQCRALELQETSCHRRERRILTEYLDSVCAGSGSDGVPGPVGSYGRWGVARPCGVVSVPCFSYSKYRLLGVFDSVDVRREFPALLLRVLTHVIRYRSDSSFVRILMRYVACLDIPEDTLQTLSQQHSTAGEVRERDSMGSREAMTMVRPDSRPAAHNPGAVDAEEAADDALRGMSNSARGAPYSPVLARHISAQSAMALFLSVAPQETQEREAGWEAFGESVQDILDAFSGDLFTSNGGILRLNEYSPVEVWAEGEREELVKGVIHAARVSIRIMLDTLVMGEEVSALSNSELKECVQEAETWSLAVPDSSEMCDLLSSVSVPKASRHKRRGKGKGGAKAVSLGDTESLPGRGDSAAVQIFGIDSGSGGASESPDPSPEGGVGSIDVEGDSFRHGRRGGMNLNSFRRGAGAEREAESRRGFQSGTATQSSSLYGVQYRLASESVKVTVISGYIAESLWSTLVTDLAFHNYDDEERYSVQSDTRLLRNILLEACAAPFGYPLVDFGEVLVPFH
ncbi:Pecanex, partial [Kipferlia bialata]